MPHTFQITVPDALYDAVDVYVGVDPDAFVDEFVTRQVREIAKTVINAEVNRLVDASLPVPNTRAGIIASAKSYKESQIPPVVP